MGAADVAGALLSLVAVIGIIWIMIRGPRLPTRRTGADGSPWPSLTSALDSTFAVGLLSVVSVGTWMFGHGAGASVEWSTGFLVGGLLAGVFGLIGITGRWNLDGLLTQVLAFPIGAIGIILTLASFAADSAECAAPQVGQRIASFAVVGVALVLGGLLALVRGLATVKPGTTLLGAFAALTVVDILLAMSNPLGVVAADLGVGTLTIVLVTAFALGFAAAIWPGFTLNVASVAVLAGAVFGVVVGAGSVCTPGVVSVAILGPVIAYVVIYLLVKRVTARWSSPEMG